MPRPLKTSLIAAVDAPDAMDGSTLRALAEFLWPQRQAIAGQWSQRLVETGPEVASAEVSLEALTGLNEAFLTLFLQQARDGDLFALYEAYYDMNYRLIDLDRQRAPGGRISLQGLYASARISGQVIESHLAAAPHELQLAWSHLSGRLAMIVGLAYSECREEHIQQSAELLQANAALHVEIERRQHVEESLRREKSFADTTLDSLPGIFYLFDTEGRFLRWNTNFEEVSGYSSAELARLHPVDLFAADEKAYIVDRIAEVFATGAATAEADLISKSGMRTPHFFTGLRVTVGGVLCVIGMGIDISERKRMEEALQASSAELARSNQIKTYFAATISHELRNTFNAIMISNELMLADDGTQLAAEHRDLLRNVQRRVLEAIQIIHATLELTRSEMQPGFDHAASIDVGDLLEDLSHEVAAVHARSDVLLCWNVPSRLPPFHTDSVKLKMILKNLVENALRFTPEGRIDVSVGIEDGVLSCTVSDTGIGIPGGELSRIFEPFHQAHGRANGRGGTGLGLYIVRRLVDLLGGTIKVDSIQGQGTTFALRLPPLERRGPSEPESVSTRV